MRKLLGKVVGTMIVTITKITAGEIEMIMAGDEMIEERIIIRGGEGEGEGRKDTRKGTRKGRAGMIRKDIAGLIKDILRRERARAKKGSKAREEIVEDIGGEIAEVEIGNEVDMTTGGKTERERGKGNMGKILEVTEATVEVTEGKGETIIAEKREKTTKTTTAKSTEKMVKRKAVIAGKIRALRQAISTTRAAQEIENETVKNPSDAAIEGRTPIAGRTRADLGEGQGGDPTEIGIATEGAGEGPGRSHPSRGKEVEIGTGIGIDIEAEIGIGREKVLRLTEV
jgi:hypothetical protein